MVIIKYKARWLKTLHQFAATDPWNGNSPGQFLIDEYVMMPLAATKAVDSTHYAHRLGFRSKTGGSQHMIPESLVELWRRGQIPPERIPSLVHSIAPRLMKEDFDLILHQSLKQIFGIPLIAVFAVVALVISVGTWSKGHFSPALALGLGALMTIFVGAIVLFSRQSAHTRRKTQMKWLLDVQAGAQPEVLKGRTSSLLKRFAVIYAILIVLILLVFGGVFAWMHFAGR